MRRVRSQMKNASRAIKLLRFCVKMNFGRVQNDSDGSGERVVVTKLGTEANNITKKQLSKFESIQRQKSVPSS